MNTPVDPSSPAGEQDSIGGERVVAVGRSRFELAALAAGVELGDKTLLLPCPLCGRAADLVDFAGWEILCECGLTLCLVAPEQMPLVAAWNRRATPPVVAGPPDEFEDVSHWMPPPPPPTTAAPAKVFPTDRSAWTDKQDGEAA